MPDEVCAERVALANAIAEAVKRSYAARAAYNEALKKRHDTASIESELDAARKEEHTSFCALNTHREAHGC